ncbi:MAG: glycosyltransferase, partial [Alphaproteobacteria bacterium]|nr:glycosyltransferase [Alphaproteobacteria bacterium]
MARLPWFHIVGLGIVWTVLVWVGLNYRPLMPIDETRYLSVAWEMWLRSEWLVPHLNGETYAHKPPLLFWIIKAGWVVFGVDDTWPRMVAPLFGLAGLGLAWALARRLWPDDTHGIAILVPWILLGSLLWTVFATVTMFDMLNAFFSVLGAFGVVLAWQGRARIGWPLVAVAIGLGVLAKGPVILIYI